MSETVIKVENLSKRYRIGVEDKADTFAGQLRKVVTYPINNLKRIISLSRFSGVDDPTIFWALKDINFEVKKGEVLGIIGHNGAGKSTLLKILSRITEPTTGLITIKGRVSALLEVGTGFHPELTGRDNIYMNGTILGMRKREIDQKFEEIVDFSGVSKHLDTPVKFYSSGMKVRLAFSVAAHLEPEILIIDEVLAVGDAEFQKKCLGKMEDVAGEGRTVLFVSHNLSAVKNLCNKGLLLNNGRVEYVGESGESIDRYLNTQSESKSFSPQGNNEIFINDFVIKGDKGEKILSENPVRLEINFQNNIDSEILGSTFEIVNMFNQVIIHQGAIIDKDCSRGIYNVEFILSSGVLKPGTYSINLIFGIRRSYVIYKADRIATFEIESGDYIQSNKSALITIPMETNVTLVKL